MGRTVRPFRPKEFPVPLTQLQTIRAEADSVIILDQAQLPHRRVEQRLTSLADAAHAIAAMQVRGAPLIGATAAYGLALALAHQADDATLASASQTLAATRPTAVNLHWALHRMTTRLAPLPAAQRGAAAWREAQAIATEDAATNRRIGDHGLELIAAIFRKTGRPVQLMTHCNAGWLATVAWGTALAPVYRAQEAGIPVHVWVSETRPRNQGLLTAWELAEAGIAHTLMADNAAGHVLRSGKTDLVIVGADRVAANGDVANKVGTSLKALAAQAYGIPFYVAAPESTIDRSCPNGEAIPIEERCGDEVRFVPGLDKSGNAARVAIVSAETPVCNPAFDVTAASWITGIITERGIFAPDQLSAA